jgi:hypothetical protein
VKGHYLYSGEWNKRIEQVVLFSYMIFWILMTLNNIVSFLNEGTKNCKNCNILITDTNFTSNLTNKNYFTRSYDDLNCKSANVGYGLECNLYGLVYVGETKGKLHIRICGNRSGIIHNVNDIVYQHFNQPDHSILSMRVRIIEKIYNRTNNPNLATPLRRQREDY